MKKKITRKIIIIIEIIKFICLFPIAKIWGIGKNIIIVSERGDDARDNGYYIYKYICQKHPEIDVYYVITHDSEDYQNVKDYGEVIIFRSIKHYIVFLAARARICTHLTMCAPDGSFYRKLKELGLLPGKRVWLGHGITKDNLKIASRSHAYLDLITCGAEPEYNYFLNNFGYDKTVVKYTGLARFDGLHNIQKKSHQILIMTTWRRILRDVDTSEFIHSEFFEAWNRVLSDDRLHMILENNDLKLIFYPHYELQPYIDCFQYKNKRIIVARKSKYDVQNLLKDSSLLITDFSSVFFDFAYMNKPVIYYQFDEDDFFNYHYDKGYFDYRLMGFGPVCTLHDSLIDEIHNVVKGNCIMDSVYQKRVKNFFPLNDAENCRRIFDEINQLLMNC